MYEYPLICNCLPNIEVEIVHIQNITTIKIIKAWAELCQAQFKVGIAKTVFPDVDIAFVYPVLQI